ncbi:DUF1761 domain-containing protein [Planococcus sp. A6]|uniref:DUF1761 domain-containing protein n=1 Tax=Planococcus sp. A6 TaxID=2992760 RepID=UPI00237A480F|nr:DUF1761 domain-containing protein [Planococcus sp. A6]MDE0584227.1 DUF1761 domain-containing protein [Planococcus sp. A6]
MIDFQTVNVLAVLIGGVLYMIYGAVYYSILVGKENQETGAMKYVFSVITAFLSSFVIATLVQMTDANSLFEGAVLGGMIGLVIALVYLKNALFGLISKKNVAIAIGDHLVIFLLLGAFHGLFT